MRLTAFGASGLGAAALLTRVNLPLSLAVGAASTAVDKLAERSRAKAAEAQVLARDASQAPAISEAARSAIAAPRSLAHTLGLSPERLLLPELAELLAALTAIREAAFAYTRDEAIAEAANRWWRWARWLLLPLVNLPLLALFADVAYRVVRGYWQQQYVGASYFLNALALGALLSLAGATIASASLRGAVSAALRLGRGRFDAALADLAAGLLDRVRRAEDEGRRAGRLLGSLRATDGVTGLGDLGDRGH